MYRTILVLLLLFSFGCSKQENAEEKTPEKKQAEKVEESSSPFPTTLEEAAKQAEERGPSLLGLGPESDARLTPDYLEGEVPPELPAISGRSPAETLGEEVRKRSGRLERQADGSYTVNPDAGITLNSGQLNRAIEGLVSEDAPALPDFSVTLGDEAEGAEVKKIDVGIPNTRLRLSHEEKEDGEQQTGVGIQQKF